MFLGLDVFGIASASHARWGPGGMRGASAAGHVDSGGRGGGGDGGLQHQVVVGWNGRWAGERAEQTAHHLPTLRTALSERGTHPPASSPPTAHQAQVVAGGGPQGARVGAVPLHDHEAHQAVGLQPALGPALQEGRAAQRHLPQTGG